MRIAAKMAVNPFDDRECGHGKGCTMSQIPLSPLYLAGQRHLGAKGSKELRPLGAQFSWSSALGTPGPW